MSIADSGSIPLIHTFGQAELCYQFKSSAIGGHVFKSNAMERLALHVQRNQGPNTLGTAHFSGNATQQATAVYGQRNQGRRAFPSA